MESKDKLSYFFYLIAGLLIGVFCALFFAQKPPQPSNRFNGKGFSIMAKSGNFRYQIWQQNGPAGFAFYNNLGQNRLDFGIYGDEKLSWINFGKRDHGWVPRFMFRLDGTNENPMLFFKNKKDNHVIDMGVDINDPEENPYLVYWTKDRKKIEVFGKFPYLN